MDIHAHWHYFRSGDRSTEAENRPIPSTLLSIREPAVVKNGRRRPKRDDRSTKRLPSNFKLIQGKGVTDRPPPSTMLAAATPTTPPPLTTPPAAAKKKRRGPDLVKRKPQASGKVQGAPQAQTGARAGDLVGLERAVVTE